MILASVCQNFSRTVRVHIDVKCGCYSCSRYVFK